MLLAEESSKSTLVVLVGLLQAQPLQIRKISHCFVNSSGTKTKLPADEVVKLVGNPAARLPYRLWQWKSYVLFQTIQISFVWENQTREVLLARKGTTLPQSVAQKNTSETKRFAPSRIRGKVCFSEVLIAFTLALPAIQLFGKVLKNVAGLPFLRKVAAVLKSPEGAYAQALARPLY